MFKLCILFCLAEKTKIDDRRAQTREYQEVLKSMSTTQLVKRDESP